MVVQAGELALEVSALLFNLCRQSGSKTRDISAELCDIHLANGTAEPRQGGLVLAARRTADALLSLPWVPRADTRQVARYYIAPGKPTQNAFIESFIGGLA